MNASQATIVPGRRWGGGNDEQWPNRCTSQKSAWFTLHRIRVVMQDELTRGECLAGKSKLTKPTLAEKSATYMHKAKQRPRAARGRQSEGRKGLCVCILESTRTGNYPGRRHLAGNLPDIESRTQRSVKPHRKLGRLRFPA